MSEAPKLNDPSVPHPQAAMGHEPSDFSYYNVLWILPFAVLLIFAFTGISIFWFRSAADQEIRLKQGYTTPARDLEILRLSEEEVLTQYKADPAGGGKVRIPIARAMELVAQEAAAGRSALPQGGAQGQPQSPTAVNAAVPASASAPGSPDSLRRAQPKSAAEAKSPAEAGAVTTPKSAAPGSASPAPAGASKAH